MVISSKDNEIVKHIKRLTEKKYRDEYNEFVIEGIRIIEEAIVEKASIKKIIITESFNANLLNIEKYEIITLTDNLFKSISDVSNPQGILAIIEKNVNKEIDYNNNLFLLLDEIQDPGNIGTILRTADSVGLNQIIVSKNSADIFNPKVVRSTMGAIFRVSVIYCDLEKEIKELKEQGFRILATDLKGAKSIYDTDFNKSAIVIGNEGNGVSKSILDLADERIIIPMKGKTESLNASVATGIILYKAIWG